MFQDQPIANVLYLVHFWGGGVCEGKNMKGFFIKTVLKTL